MENNLPHYDVVVVGAGISGIGAGHHLQEKCPDKTFIIFEGRDCLLYTSPSPRDRG